MRILRFAVSFAVNPIKPEKERTPQPACELA